MPPWALLGYAYARSNSIASSMQRFSVQCTSRTDTPDQFSGLSMGMSFLRESHGKHPMGWDGTAHICISHETVAMS